MFPYKPTTLQTQTLNDIFAGKNERTTQSSLSGLSDNAEANNHTLLHGLSGLLPTNDVLRAYYYDMKKHPHVKSVRFYSSTLVPEIFICLEEYAETRNDYGVRELWYKIDKNGNITDNPFVYGNTIAEKLQFLNTLYPIEIEFQ